MTKQEAYQILFDNAEYFRNNNSQNKFIVDGIERIITTAVIVTSETRDDFKPVVYLDGNITLDLEEYLDKVR